MSRCSDLSNFAARFAEFTEAMRDYARSPAEIDRPIFLLPFDPPPFPEHILVLIEAAFGKRGKANAEARHFVDRCASWSLSLHQGPALWPTITDPELRVLAQMYYDVAEFWAPRR
jgi:hypothetical protein